MCEELKGMSPYKYRTHRMSCDPKYMFAGSLQPTDTQDEKYVSLELLRTVLRLT